LIPTHNPETAALEPAALLGRLRASGPSRAAESRPTMRNYADRREAVPGGQRHFSGSGQTAALVSQKILSISLHGKQEKTKSQPFEGSNRDRNWSIELDGAAAHTNPMTSVRYPSMAAR